MSNDGLQLVDVPGSKKFEEWVVKIGDRLDVLFSDQTESSQPSPDSNGEEKPSIFCDYPHLVFFGRVDSQTTLDSQTTAWKFVAFIKQWFGLNIRSYLKDIQEKEDLVLGYYLGLDEYIHENRNVFFEYLLINSCIILFAIFSLQNVWSAIGIISEKKVNRIDARDQRFREFYILYNRIMKDPIWLKASMLYVDNQIPWFVLETVYTKHSDLSKLVGTPINKLAFSCFEDLYPRADMSKVHHGTVTVPPGGFKHLLHMFHWSRTPKEKYLVDTRSLQPIKKMQNFCIPSASDLQLCETVFKRHDGSINVSYCDGRLSGVMQLAPWYLYKETIYIYKSLLVFERKYVNCGFAFMTYVACMTCLLQTEADVRVLRANGIVPSTRDDEKTVLEEVEELRGFIRDDTYMSNELDILSAKVMAHHQRKSPRYYGDFKSRYCSNPWITISVIAAILLFVLTFLQTLYGMLSYYKQ